MATLSSSSRSSSCEIEYVTAADSTTSTSYVDATAGTLSIPDGHVGVIYARVNVPAANTCFLRLTDNATGTSTYVEVETSSGAGTFNAFGSFTNTTGSTITAKLQFRSSAGGSVTLQSTTNARCAIMSGGFALFTTDTNEHTLNLKMFPTQVEYIGFYPQDDDGQFVLNGVYYQQDGANEDETVQIIPGGNAITSLSYQSIDNANSVIVFDWDGIDLIVTT